MTKLNTCIETLISSSHLVPKLANHSLSLLVLPDLGILDEWVRSADWEDPCGDRVCAFPLCPSFPGFSTVIVSASGSDAMDLCTIVEGLQDISPSRGLKLSGLPVDIGDDVFSSLFESVIGTDSASLFFLKNELNWEKMVPVLPNCVRFNALAAASSSVCARSRVLSLNIEKIPTVTPADFTRLWRDLFPFTLRLSCVSTLFSSSSSTESSIDMIDVPKSGSSEDGRPTFATPTVLGVSSNSTPSTIAFEADVIEIRFFSCLPVETKKLNWDVCKLFFRSHHFLKFAFSF